MNVKREAAKHSVEAFSLYQAAKSLRRAATDSLVGGEPKIAAECRAIAKRLDTRRRALVKRPR